MAKVRKLNVAQLEVGNIYVAYSARNKMLSSNGEAGRLVKLVSKSGEGAKFSILGTEVETLIANLKTRDDAWVYDPYGIDLPVQVLQEDLKQWPAFSPRMIAEGWVGKPFIFKHDEIYTCTKPEDPGFGIPLLRHKGDTLKENGQAYINNFLLKNVFPVEPPEWRIPRAERMGIGAIELPLPKKPVPPEHEAVIEALKPLLKSLKKNTGSNVSFTRVGKDLEEHDAFYRQACHFNLQTKCKFKVAYVLTTGFNEGYPNPVPRHVAIEYINYVANYSPYADAIITKDPEFIFDHGYVIDASFPKRIVVGACFCSRQVWEKPYRALAYYSLLEAGVAAGPAFLFGSQCSSFTGGKIKFGLSDCGHNHFQNKSASDACMINFLTAKPGRAGEPFSKDYNASKDEGVDGMWSSDFGNGNTIYAKLEAIKAASGYDRSVPVEDGIERAAEVIEDWCAAKGIQANP